MTEARQSRGLVSLFVFLRRGKEETFIPPNVLGFACVLERIEVTLTRPNQGI